MVLLLLIKMQAIAQWELSHKTKYDQDKESKQYHENK
jgi:hypothetical protein